MAATALMTPFAEWLDRRMKSRRPPMNQSTLALALRTSSSTVNAWFTRNATPGRVHCQGIARVFGVSEDVVLEAAGYRKGSETEDAEIIPEVAELLRELSPEDQRLAAVPAIETAIRILRQSRGEGES